MARDNRVLGGLWPLRESVDRATEYLHLEWYERITVLAGSLLVLAVDVMMVLIAIKPLYVITGRIINGHLGIIDYQLTVLGKLQTIPQMESMKDLSFLLLFAAVYSILLVLPSIVYPSKRVPRVFLETAVAGYIASELGLTLLVSFLRIIQDSIIPSIPLSGSIRSSYGFFQVTGSVGHSTRFGLIALHMREYFIFIGIIFVLMAVILALYIIEYYREIEDTAPLIPNPS